MALLAFVIAALLLLTALYIKRRTITNRDAIAFGLVAIVVFLVLSGALNAIHVPALSIHLFGER